MLGFEMGLRQDKFGWMKIAIDPARHFNPQDVAHGGVSYSLADTAVGSANGNFAICPAPATAS